ncbi:MAG: glycosyltransferase family 2 protein [Segetibacter sp.]|nr:glycosyltransferase family 2 protein [Segetibacter sp.]
MKISGFTIIKNAIINDYPIVEAITSILPVVDEMIVLVGDSSDATKELVQSINSEKIKIFDSVWDHSLRKGGAVLAVETNKAFALIDPESTWAFYIQADEAVHEKYLPAITEACKKYKDDQQVEGLLFNYLHFYGTYDYVGDSRQWYNREIRIIRNDKSISAYKDAQGFRKGRTKLKVKPIDAFIYHYGWVKSPAQMKKKMKEVSKYWHEESDNWKSYMNSEDFFNFEEFDSLDKFTGSHPAVLQQRIKEQNWNVKLDLTKKRFSAKDKFLYWFEKKTGIRLFDFKNYKII